MVSNDKAKLAVLGARDARTIFGDKFSKSREVENFGRQELIDYFLIFRAVAHISSDVDQPDFAGGL
jgi:hypothetical protein